MKAFDFLFFFTTRRPPSGSVQWGHAVQWLMCFFQKMTPPKIHDRLHFCPHTDTQKRLTTLPIMGGGSLTEGFLTETLKISDFLLFSPAEILLPITPALFKTG